LAFTKRQIQKELGAPVEQIFEYFSPRPIASGSIAQVYKARLNGQDVAVKVRHPNVEEHIALDFIIMKAVASLVDMLPGMDWLKLSETMSQFSSTIASQTKLDIEGRHLYLFNHYFRRWRGVTFPKPMILTESVLVESFEHGESVAHYTETLSNHVGGSDVESEDDAAAAARSRTDLAHFIVTTGEDTYLKMLLQDNLMHADLHPGNILIQPYVRGMGTGDADAAARRVGAEAKAAATTVPTAPAGSSSSSSSSSKSRSSSSNGHRRGRGTRAVDAAAQAAELSTRIVLVDAGMVARLVPEEQRNFIGRIEAMGEGRGEEAADHVMRFTAAPTYDAHTRANFRRGMKELFANECRGYGHNVNIGRALRGILNLVRLNKITIDANYATLVMNCLCLDSLAASLSPTYNILDGAKPLLRFHRACKRIPGARIFLRAAIPVARWLKRQSDKLFLARLQRKQKSAHT
jgi:predicted unusual protein kinase regulating ubiquinone biosynthesis (AarF/ABC1/UbiB family)